MSIEEMIENTAEENIDITKEVCVKDPGLELIKISPDDLEVNPHNNFSIDSIEELQNSIRVFGLRQPLDVITNPPGSEKKYRIIGGERRFTAITDGINKGFGWFEDGIPCTFAKHRPPVSTTEERIMVIEENIHNRDLSHGYLDKIKELFFLYEKRREEDPSFPKSIVKHLADRLGIGVRQAYKVTAIAKEADDWIHDAVSNDEMSLDTASVIVHLEKEKQEELKKYFEENHLITSDVLDKYRKKKTVEVQETDGEPYGISEYDGEDNLKTPKPLASNNENVPSGVLEGVDLKQYEDPDSFEFCGLDSPQEDTGFGYPDDVEDMDESVPPLGGVMSVDLAAEEMSNALYWFSQMSSKGMSDVEATYVDSMFKYMKTFYFDSFTKKGYIPETVKDTVQDIVEKMQKLL